MKAKEIEQIKELSQEVVNWLPVNLSTDGNGNFYTQGKIINAFDLTAELTKAITKSNELNNFIQCKLKNKKQKSKI